ncbi:MAG: hypothetical protein QW470_00530 [Candidatus Caldarchaeum sp.]|uniref:Glutamine amidotransferase type-2 domain-containing protein n=1 Tax=Caldiarchaeum subterraneum TaxID=311458 RepID=A0A7C5L7G9_CALS0
MCRMVVLRFNDAGRDFAADVFDALVQASKDDPYLKQITGDDGRHCHGCGFTAALKTSFGWKVTHERFDAEPMLAGEQACKANLEALSEMVEGLKKLTANAKEASVIIHSRRTRNEPRGVHGAHPFKEETLLKAGGQYARAEIYLAHNGGVEKHEIASELNIPSPELYTDSHLYLRYLASKVSLCGVDELPDKLAKAIAESKPLSKSALDLGIMVFPQVSEPLLFAAGYVARKDDVVRWRYYEPVLIEADGLVGYVSSTVRDVLIRRRADAGFRSFDNSLVMLKLPKPSMHAI